MSLSRVWHRWPCWQCCTHVVSKNVLWYHEKQQYNYFAFPILKNGVILWYTGIGCLTGLPFYAILRSTMYAFAMCGESRWFCITSVCMQVVSGIHIHRSCCFAYKVILIGFRSNIFCNCFHLTAFTMLQELPPLIYLKDMCFSVPINNECGWINLSNFSGIPRYGFSFNQVKIFTFLVYWLGMSTIINEA